MTGWLSDLLIQLHADRVDMQTDRMKEMLKAVPLGHMHTLGAGTTLAVDLYAEVLAWRVFQPDGEVSPLHVSGGTRRPLRGMRILVCT